MKYEAVHPFLGGWEDLHRRMASNRRVFGYFHSSLPDEPLVLLHTALMDTVPSTIDQILQGGILSSFEQLLCIYDYWFQDIMTMVTMSQSVSDIDAGQTTEGSQARVAAFYSISSTQKGLSGIDLGNYLIKEVCFASASCWIKVPTLWGLFV